MLRVAICEDVLSELQKQTQIIQSIMARLSKNVKFFCFRSGEELLMETDTTGNMDIVFLDVEMLGISGIETARILRERDSRVILIFVSCHNQYCKEMIEKAEKLGKKLLLPIDTTIAKEFPDPIDAEIEVSVVDADKIPADMMGLDIGPKTMALFADAAKSAKTVVWNGPMGVFENPVLKKGTVAVCEALAEADATTIIGGGDSATAAINLGYADKMSHISTGGGASLEYLEGKVLPGIAVIADKN